MGDNGIRHRYGAGMNLEVIPRQLEILSLIRDGCPNKQTGLLLGITEETVKSHLVRIFERLNVVDRTSAVIKAIRLGLVALE